MHRGSTDAERRKLDARAYQLREQGLTYKAIGDRLGESLTESRRRVIRHKRVLCKQAHAESEPPSHRE